MGHRGTLGLGETNRRIDALRGASILAALLLHLPAHSRAAAPAFLAPALLWNGDNGVIVFFAVSGFLITATCLRQIPALAFYRLRFARIAPCLLAVARFLERAVPRAPPRIPQS